MTTTAAITIVRRDAGFRELSDGTRIYRRNSGGTTSWDIRRGIGQETRGFRSLAKALAAVGCEEGR